MTISPFDFSSYKAFLLAWLEGQPHGGHGLKTVIAKAAQCNPAYITQVLSANADLSLEQAEKLQKLLGLNPEELDFFLLLVEKDRAGTATLREHFKKKIETIQKKRSQLKNRIHVSMDLSQEVQMKYFSSWMYAAVHVATTIPSLQDAQAIARDLKLEIQTVKEILQFLVKHGLILQGKNGFQAGTARLHLPHDSDLISKHHQNWRVQAMKSLDQIKENDLHYSSIVSISRSDFQSIRENLLKAIQRSKDTIRDSKEEILVSFCLDFFRVSANDDVQ